MRRFALEKQTLCEFYGLSDMTDDKIGFGTFIGNEVATNRKKFRTDALFYAYKGVSKILPHLVADRAIKDNTKNPIDGIALTENYREVLDILKILSDGILQRITSPPDNTSFKRKG